MATYVDCLECEQLFCLARDGITSYETRWNAFYNHLSRKACPTWRKRGSSHKGNGSYNGPFAFTLTKSPRDSVTVADMIKAVKKIVSQKSCPVIKYAWYLEYKGTDEDGLPTHPHIHGMYETESGGRIEKKHFARAWGIWEETQRLGAGFRGGYHRPVRSDEAYSQYIKKDGGIGDSSDNF